MRKTDAEVKRVWMRKCLKRRINTACLFFSQTWRRDFFSHNLFINIFRVKQINDNNANDTVAFGQYNSDKAKVHVKTKIKPRKSKTGQELSNTKMIIIKEIQLIKKKK